MKNIKILSDSSISIDKNDPLYKHVTLIPLSIIHNNNQYLDQIDLSSEDVNRLIRDNQMIQTSQPSIGKVVEILEEVKNENYDHIYIITVSSKLSGTINSITQAVDLLNLENVSIVDTMSVAGPAYFVAKTIYDLNNQGKSSEEILNAVQASLDDTTSYVYPETLEQLKRGGRISKGAATLASLLKIKPILVLENKGVTIEKFATARTESKVYEKMVEEMVKHNIKPETHELFYLENVAKDKVATLDKLISDTIGKFESKTLTLPAVLVTHIGIGGIALQWIHKVSWYFLTFYCIISR